MYIDRATRHLVIVDNLGPGPNEEHKIRFRVAGKTNVIFRDEVKLAKVLQKKLKAIPPQLQDIQAAQAGGNSIGLVTSSSSSDRGQLYRTSN